MIIILGNSSNSSTSVQTETSNSAAVTAESDSGNNTLSTVEPKADTASTSTSGVQEVLVNTESDDSTQNMPQQSSVHSQNPEERDIIETMDADTQNQLRQRRLAHFESPASTSSDSKFCLCYYIQFVN